MGYYEERLKLSYTERSAKAQNSVAKKLFELMEEKQTNLCLAVDEPEAEKVLELAENLGDDICVLKTHIDIIEDYSHVFLEELQKLSQKHNFIIFEDRKFADIGNTVKMQYGKGIYKIADWAEIVNCHVLPGPGIIEGLREVAQEKKQDRGLIILAQMSSKGSLFTDEYTKKAVEMAENYSDFAVGFIGNGGKVEELKKLSAIAKPEFIIMTPGVNLSSAGDKLMQQYTTPEVVVKAGSDVIIVGRGIYGEENPKEAAKNYKEAGWKAYKERCVPSF